MITKRKPKRKQDKIDLRDVVNSRRTWQPDWEAIDRDMPRINRELRKKHGKRPVNE